MSTSLMCFRKKFQYRTSCFDQREGNSTKHEVFWICVADYDRAMSATQAQLHFEVIHFERQMPPIEYIAAALLQSYSAVEVKLYYIIE